jgi:O-antigen/teichoic acid export membrane protein
MSDVEKEVQHGAFVNALGLVGKMAGPSFLVLVIRLYGADAYGVYATAYALVEMGPGVPVRRLQGRLGDVRLALH